MTSTTADKELKALTANDRCDQCGSQAYVSVNGISGELMFCSHHYTKIEKDPVANEKMQAFAYVINDERDKVSDKRAGL